MSRETLTPDPFEADEMRALEAALADAPPHSDEDREWSALVAMVREEPPRRDPVARVALDRAVARGFTKPVGGSRFETPATQPSWLARLRPAMPALAVLLVGAIVITSAILATSGGGGSDDGASSSSSGASAATAAPVTPKSAQSGDAASATAAPLSRPLAVPPRAPSPSALSRAREAVRSTQLDLTTTPGKLQDAADGVVRVTQAAGGVVESSQVDATSSHGDASFVLRVPGSKLDETIRGCPAWPTSSGAPRTRPT